MTEQNAQETRVDHLQYDPPTARPLATAAENMLVPHYAGCLRFDPWAGDRDSDARTFRDKLGVTRKPATCAICFEAIPVGSTVRMQTQQSTEERKVMTFKFCPTCCDAMALCVRDEMDDRLIEARYALGRRNAEALRKAERLT